MKNFNVICGSNNSGKTHLTYTLYGVMFYWLSNAELDLGRKIESQIDKDGIARVTKKELEEQYETIVKKLPELMSKRLPAIFSIDKSYFKNTKLSFSDFNAPNFKDLKDSISTIQFGDETYHFHFNYSEDHEVLEIKIIRPENPEGEKLPSYFFRRVIDRSICDILFSDAVSKPFLIPAERTGLSLFYKELDINRNALIETLQSGKELKRHEMYDMIDKNVSRYALPINESIRFVRDFDRIQKQVSRVAKEHPQLIERLDSVIDGKFYSKDGNFFYVNNRRGENRVDIPLYIASQFLKSLFPLCSYIKHVSSAGDLLIFDEPELSLHPDNQKRLVRILSALSKVGVKVVITTHSDHIIQEIENLVQLERLGSKAKQIKERCFITDDTLLEEESVGFYVFQNGVLKHQCFDSENGYNVESISEAIHKQNMLTSEISLLLDSE